MDIARRLRELREHKEMSREDIGVVALGKKSYTRRFGLRQL
jgi:hypothetical protein